MRIIGGAKRGLALSAPEDRTIRPTSARMREALFDRLEHAFAQPDGRPAYAGMRVIDACCGVGAMAIEALSRGAAEAVLIDSAPIALRYARKNADAAGFAERCRFVQADVTAPPAGRAGLSRPALWRGRSGRRPRRPRAGAGRSGACDRRNRGADRLFAAVGLWGDR